MSLVLIRYVLRAAVRDRIIVALLLALLAGTSLAVFMASSAVIERGEFAGVFAGGGVRLIGVFGLTLFVIFHVRRSYELKDIEFLLSRPISRAQFLLSFAAAFSLMAVVTGIAEGLCLSAIMSQFFHPVVALWTVSIIIENIIMVNVALFFALFLSSAASGAMACLGFYVFARMMGQLLGIVDMGSDIIGAKIFMVVLQVISAVTPRLDLMGQTSWLIYGPEGAIGYGFLLMQGVVFTALILTASMIDLARRKF